jgi:hypothetical protein
MKHILGAMKRSSYGTAAALFLLAAVLVALPARQATAAALVERSLKLSSSVPSIAGTPVTAGGVPAPAGSAANGNKVTHTYLFQASTDGDIQAFQFQFCSSPFGYLEYAPDNTAAACTDPDGLNADLAPAADVRVGPNPATIGAVTPVSYPVNATATTNNPDVLVVENAGAPVTATAGEYVQVTFVATDTNYISNPIASYLDNTNQVPVDKTFFVHIETYALLADRTTGAHVDEGTVASSIANAVAITTRVQETLKFSVGTTTPVDDGGASCTPVTGTAALALGDANNSLSAATTYKAKSYFRISTNASSGAQVLYAGQTLTSTAADTIDAIGGTAVSVASPGTEQFGFTIASADGDSVLDELDESGYDFASPTLYAFDATSDTNPQPVAASTGFISCDTGVVEYAANIANDTEAGIYSTRISYIAVPTY